MARNWNAWVPWELLAAVVLLGLLFFCRDTSAGTIRPLEETQLGGNCYEYTMCEDEAQETGAITAYAEGTPADGIVEVTDAAHGLETGAAIIIADSTNYNGSFIVTVTGANSFTILETWVADDGASTWVSTGACANAAGSSQVHIGMPGKYAWTFYGTQSVGDYTCNVYSNDTGYTVTTTDKQQLHVDADALTQDNQVLSFDGLFRWVWVECPTIATTATVTLNVCPL